MPENGEARSVRSRIEARLEATGLLRPLLRGGGVVAPAQDRGVEEGHQVPGSTVRPGTASSDGEAGEW